PPHVLVGLAQVFPALRVPYDHVVASQILEHHGRDLAGVSALVFPKDVLGSQLDARTLDHFCDRIQGGKRRTKDHFDPFDLISDEHFDLFREPDGFACRLVHLPVACNDRFPREISPFLCVAHASPASMSAATPGSSLPSKNSRLAPPPVETWLILSAKPACCTAAAESPPPTMLNAPESATAWATALVPWEKAANSKTPMGPFQRMVLALFTTWAMASLVRGPMSIPSQSAGIASTGTTWLLASGAKESATTTSSGSTRRISPFSARAKSSLA